MIRAVVLLSGGMDSAVCLAIARAAYKKDEVVAVSINYGQKHSREYDAAKEVAKFYGVTLELHNLPQQMFKTSTSVLTRPDLEMPETTYEELKLSQGVSPTYVPFRNANLLSLATTRCLQLHDENGFDGGGWPNVKEIELYYGPHSEDARGWAYPDCTPEFNGAMMNAIYIGSYYKVRLITPLQWHTKEDVARHGVTLGVPFRLTYSCYNGREKHCGKCPTCVGRKQALSALAADPTEYEDD